MAPRRLIIVMVVLLMISTALAILIPEPRPEPPPEDRPAAGKNDQTVPATERQPADRPDEADESTRSRSDPGRTIERSIRADGKPQRIAIRVGDRLVLAVRSGDPIIVEVEGAGLTEPAGPYDPARFDLLIREGTPRLVVREAGAGTRPIAVIETG